MLVNKNYKNVWVRVGQLAPIQAKFELEEELFCQKTKKVAAKKDDNKKKEPKVVSCIQCRHIKVMSIEKNDGSFSLIHNHTIFKYFSSERGLMFHYHQVFKIRAFCRLAFWIRNRV
jgi:hypothetical protein